MRVVSKSSLAAFLEARMASPDEHREWRRKRLFRMRRHMVEDRVRCALRREARMQVSEAEKGGAEQPLTRSVFPKQNAQDRTGIKGVL